MTLARYACAQRIGLKIVLWTARWAREALAFRPSRPPAAHFPAALNPDHGRAISLLNVYRTNLRALIESEAWS